MEQDQTSDFAQAPKHDLKPHDHEASEVIEDDLFDFFDEGDSDTLCSDVDLYEVVGESIIIWSYMRPHTLGVYTPLFGDTLADIAHYAVCTLDYEKLWQKLAILHPGKDDPEQIDRLTPIIPGSVVMVIPKDNCKIILSMKQLNTTSAFMVDIQTTVYELKQHLETEKGFPLSQQDIVFKGKALENHRHLYEYRLPETSRMSLLLQTRTDLPILVKPFWAQQYHLYVDLCQTVGDVINSILKNTFSTPKEGKIFVKDFILSEHVFIMCVKGKIMNKEKALGFYKLHAGSLLSLQTLGNYHKVELQPLEVDVRGAEIYQMFISQFDTWAVVGLLLHGLTQVPLDLIRLKRGQTDLHFVNAVGKIDKASYKIKMNVELPSKNSDYLNGVLLVVTLLNEVFTTVLCLKTRTMGEVKERLEQQGLPNATKYEIYHRDKKISNVMQVCTLLDNDKNLVHITLKLERFPILIHTPDNNLHQIMVPVYRDASLLQQKIHQKTGLNFKDHYLQLLGEVYTDKQIGINTLFYIEQTVAYERFTILLKTSMTRVLIPNLPSMNDIKISVWKNTDVPDSVLRSLYTFLYWHYSVAIRTSNRSRNNLGTYNALEEYPLEMYEKERLTSSEEYEHTIKSTTPAPGHKKMVSFQLEEEIQDPAVIDNPCHYMANLAKQKSQKFATVIKKSNDKKEITLTHLPPIFQEEELQKRLRRQHLLNKTIMMDPITSNHPKPLWSEIIDAKSKENRLTVNIKESLLTGNGQFVQSPRSESSIRSHSKKSWKQHVNI